MHTYIVYCIVYLKPIFNKYRKTNYENIKEQYCTLFHAIQYYLISHYLKNGGNAKPLNRQVKKTHLLKYEPIYRYAKTLLKN